MLDTTYKEKTTDVLQTYKTVEELERYLGSPFDDDNVISFKNSADMDEDEIFPRKAINFLHDWDYNQYYIPQALGGKLKSFEELLFLSRVLSRRDLSISITDAHTLLGSLPVWIGGSESQKEALASLVANRKTACLAVTERNHGSDLNTSGVHTSETNEGYVLNGEKWPINKATLTDTVCVLARTGEKKNARSLSIFLVDKSKLTDEQYTHLPKVKTLGIRACDISGINFNDALLSKDALIGKEGSGLELALKGFHITRTMCAGLSLGAVDTALRTTLRFVLKRELYGSTVFDIDHARHTLAKAFINIISCDCLAIAASRGLHVVPGQFSIWSAIVKNYVPVKVENVIQDLSIILGSRFYLRGDHDHGVFQKMMRDNAIISLFDGSTIINQHSLSLQLKFLAKKRRKKNGANIENKLEDIFTLGKELADFRYDKLDLFSKGNNEVLQGIEIALLKLGDLKGNRQVSQKVLTEITNLTIGVISSLMDLEEQALQLPTVETGHNLPIEYFNLAQDYCRLHTATTNIFMWIYNREALGDFFAQGEWLVLSLQQTLSAFNIYTKEVNKEYLENAANELLRLHTEDKLFSIIPIQTNN
ncbi:acyl-CoA dehydrogenase family protein [Aquimarina sp. 2201CG5-10]|uniref:acyl-CoA dehydrogenase family protein n=1 Tax=Aquimarina callyspongiae TaxID=3098150 RepID=UPI002AB43086|nr:acyl-CoA dehydrogenase family protein [Aquimarina sp. 2201CG5-10]MDY8138356.1 acyl-CoA dehydrogenase family protein [Aquimarina sp. 2201CG5-10]